MVIAKMALVIASTIITYKIMSYYPTPNTN